MVQRNQQPANLDASRLGTVSIQQDNRPMQSVARPTDVTVNPLSERLISLANRLSDKVVDNYTESAYLRGANAAASGQSADELESSWLSRPFTTAGFADEDKRLQMSKVTADISSNMAELRKKTPAEFLQYLNDKTQGLFTDTSNMSNRGKQALLENQVTFNRTLIRTQAVENAKYNIEQKAQVYTTQGNTLATMMAQAKSTGDAQAYAESGAALTTWTKSILTDDKLPMSVRYGHVKALGQLLASQDLTAPVKGLIDSGLLKDMPSEDLAALQGSLRESEGRTQLQDHIGWYSQDAAMRTQQDTTGDVMPDQFAAHLNSGIASGAIKSVSEYESRLLEYQKGMQKTLKNGQISAAFSNGDSTTLLKYNVGPDEAANLTAQNMVKQGATSSQVATSMIQIGAAHGNPAAFKKAGSLMNPALSNFGTPGSEINPDDAAQIRTVTDTLNSAAAAGDKGVVMKFMETMSPDNQAKWAYITQQVQNGKSIAQASQAYQALESQNAGMTPQEKATDNAVRAETRSKVLANIQSQGYFSRTATGIMSIFSKDAQNEWNRRIASGDQQTSLELNSVRSAMGQEVLNIQRTQPWLSAEELETQAGARLSSRIMRVGGTWNSPGALLVAPQNQTPQSALGLPSNVDTGRLGDALNALATANAPEGYNASYSITQDPTTHQNVVAVEYVGKDGVLAPGTETQYLTSSAVQTQLDEDDRAAATANGAIYGSGTTIIDPQSNIGIRVNGVNTGRVDETQMLAARVATAHFEGIRNQTYRDTKGYETNGVGISSLSPYYSGRGSISGQWTPQDIQETFQKHSDYVAQQMFKTEANTGWSRDNPNQFQFMFQMGYQGGVNWTSGKPAYRELASSMRTGDLKGALSALRNTPAYQAAGNERKQFYEAALTQGMNE